MALGPKEAALHFCAQCSWEMSEIPLTLKGFHSLISKPGSFHHSLCEIEQIGTASEFAFRLT